MGALTSGLRLRRAAFAAGVRDERVLAAVEAVPRELFVPPGLTDRAQLDQALPIAAGQTTSQPSLVALMLENLGIGPCANVLEVGAGFGYQTALLSLLAGEVHSIERIPQLARRARANLRHFGTFNVEVRIGDGMLGLPEHAPYDAVVVSAAFPEVPPALGRQLTAGGRLVQPIGHGGREIVIVFEARPEGLVERGRLCAACFVPLLAGVARVSAPVGSEDDPSGEGE